jgi:hypothetical protein
MKNLFATTFINCIHTTPTLVRKKRPHRLSLDPIPFAVVFVIQPAALRCAIRLSCLQDRRRQLSFEFL